MVLPEDSSNPIVEALNDINDSLERNNDVLKRILNHYDSVVPVMKRNADRVEEVQKEQDKTFPEQMRSIFAS
tara:strand:- start:219 stop:434 length:216 start_codon:yes stop_codon:yes gene_type:complete